MSNTEYIVIPGTHIKVYENSVVVLFRLPDIKWILHCGRYNYNGVNRKGWYFASIPSETIMPVFTEDLVAMKVISGPQPVPPLPPCPPHPPIPPGPMPPVPPAPIPVIFTPEDKKMINASMITVQTLEDRDNLGTNLDNGKIVRVNDVNGSLEYFEWDASNQTWVPATLGYRYMTREETQQEFSDTIVDIVYSDSTGLLTLVKYGGENVERELTGVAHNPTYENYVIRIPVFGRPDLVIDLPGGSSIGSMRIEPNYEISPGHFVPALVVTTIVDDHPVDVATDVTSLYNQFSQISSSSTISMYVESATSSLKADVKISSAANNVLNVDNTGLYVDISGKVDKLNVNSGYLLMSDGLGGFTTIGNGAFVKTTGVMDGTSNVEVPTANLIAAAIQAAISTITIDVEQQLEDLDTRVSDLEAAAIGQGASDEVVTSTSGGVQRSGYAIGNNVLSGQSGLLATEEAVKDAMSWKTM